MDGTGEVKYSEVNEGDTHDLVDLTFRLLNLYFFVCSSSFWLQRLRPMVALTKHVSRRPLTGSIVMIVGTLQ